MADYTVDINMSDATVNALLAKGSSLYAFKAIVATSTDGVPVVWFKTQNFATDTLVQWQVSYEAYTSLTAIVPGGQITASNHYPIDLGQRLVVTGNTGTGAVDGSGTGEAISILNQSPKHVPMTCGISQMVAGSAKPMCAFPLSGSDLDVFAPIEKVFLMFATKQVNTGTVIEQSFGQGVFIDLTAQNSRNLTYDIDAGWSWDGGVWAKAYPASTLMVPFLIESSATLSASKDKLLLAAKAA